MSVTNVVQLRFKRFAGAGLAFCRYGHARLAATVEDPSFSPAKACSPNFFSTAHGAYETGIAAANAVLKSLGR